MGKVWMLVLFVALTAGCHCHGGAYAHYLPLDQCDFYFQGHRETVPMVDVLTTRNLTSSPPILTKFGMDVVAAQIRRDCVFLPDPSMLFEQRSCAGHFHVKNHHLSGRFVNEEFASLEAFRFHQVLLAFEEIQLQDGTVLSQNDTNLQYMHPRRCVTFLTTPAITGQYNAERGIPRGDVITRMMDIVPRMLNNAHRKKLKKIRASVQHIGHDMGSLAQDVADFP